MSETPTVTSTVDRRVLTTALQALHSVITTASDEQQRDQARAAFDELQRVYLQHENKAAVQLAPQGFWRLGFFSKAVDDFIARLPEEVIAEHPAQVVMARQSANLVDTQVYSCDFRLEALDSLEGVLASLRSAAEDLELANILDTEDVSQP